MSKLYSKLAQIGFRVNCDEAIKGHIDIEKTIIEALYQIDSDSRLLSLIFSWAKIHGNHLIADKLIKNYQNQEIYFDHCPWFSAFAAYMVSLKNHKFKKAVKKFDQKIWIGGRKTITAIKMDGAVEYLKEINIMVSKKHLRIRTEDVFTVEELIKANPQYRNRFIYGANWRSEIIYAIERGLKNPYQISKELNIGYSRVWAVFNEYQLVMT
jgi:hypothetical protein